MANAIDRRTFLKSATLGAAALAVQGAGAAAGKAAKRPNLLFVMADQLALRHCGYAGARQARTPRLDAFARQSADFRNAVSSMPVCSAFRASLFTGKYTTSTGMVINELRLSSDHECFGHALTRGGYQTGYIGKWHLWANELGNHQAPKNSFVPPGPYRLGFDGYWAAYNFHHDYYNTYYHKNSPEKIFYGEGVYEPDAQTDMAIDYLRGHGGKAEPFALFLSYGTPHDPWGHNNVPEKYLKMFEGEAFPNPPNFSETPDPYGDAWSRGTPRAWKNLEDFRRVYYAMTANLDWNFGRLLDALDGAGLAEETIVVFTSDHGDMSGSHGRLMKNIFYEEAARIPFLMRRPGVIPAATVDACLSNVDMMPTVLELMGLPIPKTAEGMSLAARARGQQGPEPEFAFLQNTGACAAWEDGHEWRALRDKRYTYAIYRRDRAELLFDNEQDPYQMKNLAADPAHKETMERFRKGLAAKMASLNDTFEACTWYRDHWTKDRMIVHTARG